MRSTSTTRASSAAPASAVRDDSDLGERLVTCAVPPLPDALVAQALARGRRAARARDRRRPHRRRAALPAGPGRGLRRERSSTGGLSMNDLFSLAGRTALVTGGSRGIGRMIAAGFLAQGARVYISSRKAEACDATAAELAAAGPCFVAAGGRLDDGRRRRPGRRLRRARGQARHPGQQRRRGLGRDLRHLSRRRAGTRSST